MKSIKSLGSYSAAVPISADDVTEFHAARILLLLRHSGIAGRIDGLTKMAKLDFFVRYPDFFEVAKRRSTSASIQAEDDVAASATETAMVRHHYGPWDKRYYHILAFLEARDLIQVTKSKNKYVVSLTDRGARVAASLSERDSYSQLISRMADVKQVFGSKSGNVIKNLIYKIFEEEVGAKPLGAVIRK